MTHWFAQVMNGMTRATPLAFNQSLSVEDDHGSTMPGVLGWLFGDGKAHHTGIVINLTEQGVEVELTDVSLDGGFTSYSAPLDHYVQDTDGLDAGAGPIERSMQIAPYSVTILSLE